MIEITSMEELMAVRTASRTELANVIRQIRKSPGVSKDDIKTFIEEAKKSIAESVAERTSARIPLPNQAKPILNNQQAAQLQQFAKIIGPRWTKIAKKIVENVDSRGMSKEADLIITKIEGKLGELTDKIQMDEGEDMAAETLEILKEIALHTDPKLAAKLIDKSDARGIADLANKASPEQKKMGTEQAKYNKFKQQQQLKEQKDEMFRDKHPLLWGAKQYAKVDPTVLYAKGVFGAGKMLGKGLLGAGKMAWKGASWLRNRNSAPMSLAAASMGIPDASPAMSPAAAMGIPAALPTPNIMSSSTLAPPPASLLASAKNIFSPVASPSTVAANSDGSGYYSRMAAQSLRRQKDDLVFDPDATLPTNNALNQERDKSGEETVKLDKASMIFLANEIMKNDRKLDDENDDENREADIESSRQPTTIPSKSADEIQKQEQKDKKPSLFDRAKQALMNKMPDMPKIPAMGGAANVAKLAAKGLGAAGLVAGAGYLGYQAGSVINDTLLTNDDGSNKIANGLDSIKGWFGNSNEDKIKDADAKSAVDLYKKKVANGEKISPDLAKKVEAAGVKVDPKNVYTEAELKAKRSKPNAAIEPAADSKMAKLDSAVADGAVKKEQITEKKELEKTALIASAVGGKGGNKTTIINNNSGSKDNTNKTVPSRNQDSSFQRFVDSRMVWNAN